MAQFKIVDEFGNTLYYVGTLKIQSQAQLFVNFLEHQQIKACIKMSLSGHFDVYVYDESLQSRAKIELFKFVQEPKQAYKQAWNSGRHFKQDTKLVSSFDFYQRLKLNSVTTLIEIICVVVYLVKLFNENAVIEILGLFKGQDSFSDPSFYVHLFTPVFIHFSIMHIAFNLVMFEAFSRKIELLLGKVRYIVLFVLLAIVSNYLQYLFLPPQSVFGGMSGVVYGLIAYTAMLALNPRFTAFLNFPKGLLAISCIFIAFGFFMSGIANLCHLGGILLGIILGFVDSKSLKR